MGKQGWRLGQRMPEWTLAVLAGMVFLGNLGTLDLWGKREQRAAAEALDTLREGHWLVAEIQCRPRLEKPPLPRWTIAGLMALTGRSDEWIMRLPGALAALGTVALVVGLGRRLGGREVGLAAGLVLVSSLFFISEMRQAGNDGPLTFFTTLALYAAWRRWHGVRGWALVFYAALGFGFLCKGPVILLIVGVTLASYLAWSRQWRAGGRRSGTAPGWGSSCCWR